MMPGKQFYVYMLANRPRGVIYIGVTNNVMKRVWGHKQKLAEGFTAKYNVDNLVYYEVFDDIRDAIRCEKQLKNWHRQWKINLIEKSNPTWRDLYVDFVDPEINSG